MQGQARHDDTALDPRYRDLQKQMTPEVVPCDQKRQAARKECFPGRWPFWERCLFSTTHYQNYLYILPSTQAATHDYLHKGQLILTRAVTKTSWQNRDQLCSAPVTSDKVQNFLMIVLTVIRPLETKLNTEKEYHISRSLYIILEPCKATLISKG